MQYQSHQNRRKEMRLKTLLITLFATTAINAGTVVEVPVTIDMDAKTATGNLTGARFSDNEFESIGCGVREIAPTDGSTGFSWGFCQARVEEDNNVVCFTQNPVLLDKMAAMNDYSYVVFRWDDNIQCEYIGFSTQSQYIPEYKDKKDKKDK